MSYVQELRQKLKKLNGLQWAKKQALKRVIKLQADAQRKMHHNSLLSSHAHHGQELYVPSSAVKYFVSSCRYISEIQKDLNRRKVEIRVLQSQVDQILSTISKDAYFQMADGTIIGIHAVGFKDENGGFYQEEIWGNSYERKEDGKLQMKGGSFRVFSLFDEVVTGYKNDPEFKEISK